MPRFTVKDLLIATTLIAIGIAMICFIFRGLEQFVGEFQGDWVIPIVFALHFGGGGFIGAGIGSLFKRPWVGAAIGLVFQFVSLAFMASPRA